MNRMSTRASSWSAGVPCWADLATPDISAAQEFYSAVLGWSFPVPEVDYGGYVIASVNGFAAAGIGPLQGEQQPAWTLYLVSDDADKTAASVTESGGAVLVGAADGGSWGECSLPATQPAVSSVCGRPVPISAPRSSTSRLVSRGRTCARPIPTPPARSMELSSASSSTSCPTPGPTTRPSTSQETKRHSGAWVGCSAPRTGRRRTGSCTSVCPTPTPLQRGGRQRWAGPGVAVRYALWTHGGDRRPCRRGVLGRPGRVRLADADRSEYPFDPG
jgi:predicted enzyme related to lactoylglutathione lyase